MSEGRSDYEHESGVRLGTVERGHGEWRVRSAVPLPLRPPAQSATEQTYPDADLFNAVQNGVVDRLVNYLAIYLNDHLGGATGGVELARRLRTSNRGDDTFGPPLDRVCNEIEEDRAALERVIKGLGFSPSTVKPAGAWVAEKLGRLKLNGRLRGYSPLSRLLELEGLLMGITGKVALWKTLAGSDDVEGLEIDFEQLAVRAAEQRSTVEDLHRLAGAAISRPSASR